MLVSSVVATMVEGMGYGSMIRKDGRLTPIGLGDKVMDIDFGPFKRKGLCIPWGDIATAWRSTGIPNIEVYSAVSPAMIRMARLSKWINPIMRTSAVKRFLRKKVDARPAGPDEQRLQAGRSYVWGRVREARGNVAEARLEAMSGYLLTAKASVLIAAKMLSSPVKPGYFTPAGYFGEGLIFDVLRC